MKEFECKINRFFQAFGDSKKMVLSTSFCDRVTSRMMSVVLIEDIFYFQTDITFRKYEQIKNNSHVALCIDNIQIEGICREIGQPLKNEKFCAVYKKCFSDSYQAYSSLENERLFAIKPLYIEIWEYKEGKPYMEIIDIEHKAYKCIKYESQ